MQELFLREGTNGIERCPYFRGVLREGLHCILVVFLQFAVFFNFHSSLVCFRMVVCPLYQRTTESRRPHPLRPPCQLPLPLPFHTKNRKVFFTLPPVPPPPLFSLQSSNGNEDTSLITTPFPIEPLNTSLIWTLVYTLSSCCLY